MSERISPDDKKSEEQFAAIEIRTGHKFKRNEDGTVDHFAFDGDTHNGPECERCGQCWCMWCQDVDTWPMCDDGAISGEWRNAPEKLPAPDAI